MENTLDTNFTLREVSKIINILNTWGNVLVPGYGDNPQVNAKDNLEYLVKELMVHNNMTLEDIEQAISNLNNEV